MRTCLLFFVCIASLAWGFDERPWISEPYLFEFRPSFTLSYFPSVANASRHLSSWNEDLNLNLGVATMSNWDIQLEIDAFNSKMQSFNVESVGAQVRKLLLDDIEGDLLSWIVGFNYRVVPYYRLHDVAMPYHFVSNFEFVSSMGKEFSKEGDWLYRIYTFMAFGIANKGSPWIKADLYFEGLINHVHEWDVFVKSYFGFGEKNFINIDQFDGYYNIAHHNVDLGAGYRYHFHVYGSLGVNGLYRLYAHAYPRHLFAITIDYRFPFSLF